MRKNYTCGQGDTLDTWKPSERIPSDEIVQSQWRKKQVGKFYNQRPGIDEVKKIKMYLKRKHSDSEIMKVFGIAAETLVAIKKDRYSAVDGILPERCSHQAQYQRIDVLERAVKFISDVLFMNTETMEQYQDACGHISSLQEFVKEYDNFDEDEDSEG